MHKFLCHFVEQALTQGMADCRMLYTDSTHLNADTETFNEMCPESVSV
nr:hypothetical protein [Lelliottia aquatilis]